MFKGMKFRVKDSEHSALIQKHLFSLGYGWCTHYMEIKNIDCHFLYADKKDMSITYSNNSFNNNDYFDNHRNKEYTLKSEVTYFLVPVVEPETVELNGKKYLKEDLEAALNKLTPIK
jgi:hypothetical protein